MTEKTPRISASQLFCVLLLSRLSAEAVYPRTASQTAFEAAAAVVISELIRFLAALPIIAYSSRGTDVFGALCGKSKILGRACAAAAAALLTAASAWTLFAMSRFAADNMLAENALWLIFALAVIFAVYAAARGAEALARSGVLFLVPAAVIAVTVMIADAPHITRKSFESLRELGSNSRLLSDILERLTRGGEYLIFAAMMPYVSRKQSGTLRNTASAFAAASAAAALAVCLFGCLVLRELYGRCEYPMLAIASIADILLFKRLDGAAAAVWALCGAFRGGVMLWAAGDVLVRVFKSPEPREKEAA